MPSIVQLKNKEEDQIYPRTLANAVYTNDGQGTLEAELQKKVDITTFTTQMNLKVPTTRNVAGKPLSDDIDIEAIDIGAVPITRKVAGKPLSSDIDITALDVGAVPTTRTIVGKQLNADITISAAEIGAVPTTRTISGKPLNADVILNASDINAVPNTRTVAGKPLSSDVVLNASDVNAVPNTRTVAGKPLSSNVVLNASDVSAVSLVDNKADPHQITSNILTISTNRVLQLSDSGKYIEIDSTNNITITVPNDSNVNFPIGTEIEIIQENEGEVTIAEESGVSLHSFEDKFKIAGRYATCGIKKVGINKWRLAGLLQ